MLKVGGVKVATAQAGAARPDRSQVAETLSFSRDLTPTSLGQWFAVLGMAVPPNAPKSGRGWGPIGKIQLDGKRYPIQEYRTILLADLSGGWYLVRDVVDLSTGISSPATLACVGPISARQWLCENSFSEDEPSVTV